MRIFRILAWLFFGSVALAILGAAAMSALSTAALG